MLAGVYAASRDGVDRRGRVRAGTALIARGEFSIVVVGLVGTAADPRLGPLVAAYVLILATVGPILTRFADVPLWQRAVDPSADRSALERER